MVTTDPRIVTLRMIDFQIPTRYRNLRFDGGKREPQEARDFVTNLKDHYLTKLRPIATYPPMEEIGKGLAWVGAPGAGKTTEAVKTLLEVYHQWNIPVFFIAYADYISMRKRQWSPSCKSEVWDEIEETIDKTRTRAVLMIDDVGKEMDGASQFASKELDLLLRQRHRDALPTIITTNIPFEDWGAVYNPSMGSFIQEAFTYIRANKSDLRLPKTISASERASHARR